MYFKESCTIFEGKLCTDYTGQTWHLDEMRTAACQPVDADELAGSIFTALAFHSHFHFKCTS